MYNGADFDGNAAFSGGGFMPSQTTQTTEHQPTTFTKNNTQSLIPLTVKQINKALLSNDDKINFLIDGVDVNNVRLVGMVWNKMERVTDISFILDDGTGRIDCNRWVNDPLDTKEMDAIMEGMYVRIHGQLKGFQGKKQLMVFGVKPVTDFDEITHHFVECMYVHSYNTKLMQQASSSNQAHMPGSAMNTQTYQTAPANHFAGKYETEALTGVDKMVLNYLQLPGSLSRDKGVHQEELVSQLNLPLDTIRKSLDTLTVEALVYNTIDDYHFKTTGNA
uniref:replication protein A 32 kDa subunit B-like isoform X3 n=1 Tax=Erigeron canadensis TaxID=72917 RepID=UPI001CB8E26A|nr:replication protein A 32 kDa subunit B-like isoform X3 [Erigeron canadensis]